MHHATPPPTRRSRPASPRPASGRPGATRPRAAPMWRLDRARYRLRHHALAATLGAYMGFWHRRALPSRRPEAADVAELRRRFIALLAADLANVEAGHYPRELLFDIPYGEYLRTLPLALRDQPRVFRRARARRHDDLPADIDTSAYPAYYRRTFHWQTDGWLSRRSARLYDFSVEMLFGGVADVMRRMALPPLVSRLRARPGASALDLGCATGRFLAALRRCVPDAELHGVDLSPYYVAHAREHLAPAVSLSAQNAESLRFDSGRFDAVSAVFLLHELPSDVRRRVVAEAGRVLRPDGRLVLCDAVQHRECGRLRVFLDNFPRLYHEPYFKGYLGDDLEAVVEDAGLRVESSESHFLVKVVVARP